MHGNLTDGRDRIREETRALIEECRRKNVERDVPQIVVATYHGLTGPFVSTPGGENLLCRSQNHRKETPESTGDHPSEITIPWLPGVCVRLVEGAPYYIK